MTVEYGILMFLYNMIAIFIGATIAYFIINALQQKEKEMKIGNTHIIKFTKQDIRQVYLQSHKWDTWAEIKLKCGSNIRCHSTELDMMMKDKYKSYVAYCTHTHYWVSNNNGDDIGV